MASKKRANNRVRSHTPEWVQWKKECTSIRSFLRRLKNSTSMGGEKWRVKMTEHYTNRLAELRANEPKKYK